MDHIVDTDSERSILCDSISKQQKQQQKQQSQPRIVLEEEEYTSTLSHIVTRDYYPALHTLRRDAAILDARGRGDISEAVAIRRKFRAEEMQREREWMEEKQEEETDALVVSLYCDNENGKKIDNLCSTSSSRQQHGAQAVVVRKRPRPLQHESITGFHARVTSEDNAEFEINQERERKEREEFLSLVYDARADKDGRLMIENELQSRNDSIGNGGITVRRLLGCKNNNSASSKTQNKMRTLLCDTPIGLSSDLFDAPPSAGLRITNGADGNNVTTRSGIGRNGLFFQPQHHSSVNYTRSGGVEKLAPSSGGTFLALEDNDDVTDGKLQEQESNSAKSDNRLMPPPPSRFPSASSSIVSHQAPNNDDETAKPHPTKSTSSIDQRHQLVEYLPKPSLPDIHPPATRFPYQNESRLLSKHKNHKSVLDPSNHGCFGDSIRSYSTDASDTTDLDESPRPLHLERAAYQRARVRENETFLPMTPLIRPGREEEKPWPQVVGSESSIPPSASWEPTFDVMDENNREKVARKAEKRISERSKTYRSAGTNKRGRMEKDDASVFSSRSRITSTHDPLDRMASLTPAARALLEASTHARKPAKKSSGLSSSCSVYPSRIFSSAVSGTNAGSRDSFGSSLRMSYTPNRNAGNQSTSSLRMAAAGATPR